MLDIRMSQQKPLFCRNLSALDERLDRDKSVNENLKLWTRKIMRRFFLTVA